MDDQRHLLTGGRTKYLIDETETVQKLMTLEVQKQGNRWGCTTEPSVTLCFVISTTGRKERRIGQQMAPPTEPYGAPAATSDSYDVNAIYDLSGLVSFSLSS
jgi:hypothetical protein